MYKTKPAIASRIFTDNILERNSPIRFRKAVPTSWISLTITEGKNRQVRRMGAAVGFQVLRLIQVNLGNYSLPFFNPGQ